MADERNDDKKTGGDQNVNEGNKKEYVALPDDVLAALHDRDLMHLDAVSALPFSD